MTTSHSTKQPTASTSTLLTPQIIPIPRLSPTSLTALSNLARYKPPLDEYPAREARAAVLVGLFPSRDGERLNVLLTTRSTSLRTYAGEVALPGGKMDPEDENLEATARREAQEEVGLPNNPTQVEHLTALRPFLTRGYLLVTPIVCFIKDYALQPQLNPSEVSSIFSFPLSAFLYSTPDPSFANSLPPLVREGKINYHEEHDYPSFDNTPYRYHSFKALPVSVTGLTAEILIRVAEVAYGRKPEFERDAVGQLGAKELIERARRDPKWEVRLAEGREREERRRKEKERKSRLRMGKKPREEKL